MRCCVGSFKIGMFNRKIKSKTFSANTGTANIRNNLRPLLKKYNVTMESEKEIKSMEDLYTVS
jgi:hypothetical protein